MTEKRRLGEIRTIPLDRIETLNHRERHITALDEMVSNIKTTRIKEPITVRSHQEGGDAERFQLLIGEGNLNAYMYLGETHIPARVVKFKDDDELIMFLSESLPRKKRNPLKTVAAFEAVRDLGYGPREIAEATGLRESYTQDMLTLLEQFEERFHLIETGALNDRKH